jgi:hypothetical protein
MTDGRQFPAPSRRDGLRFPTNSYRLVTLGKDSRRAACFGLWLEKSRGGRNRERIIWIETPAFDGVLTEVQSARTREFLWFIGLWAKFFSQGLLWSPRTDLVEQS